MSLAIMLIIITTDEFPPTHLLNDLLLKICLWTIHSTWAVLPIILHSIYFTYEVYTLLIVSRLQTLGCSIFGLANYDLQKDWPDRVI